MQKYNLDNLCLALPKIGEVDLCYSDLSGEQWLLERNYFQEQRKKLKNVLTISSLYKHGAKVKVNTAKRLHIK